MNSKQLLEEMEGHIETAYKIAKKHGNDATPEAIFEIVKMLQYQERNEVMKDFTAAFKNAHLAWGNGKSALEFIGMQLRDRDHFNVNVNNI